MVIENNNILTQTNINISLNPENDLNPDYEIEQFWFQLKTAMNNFYNQFKNIKTRNIYKWSNTLNELQFYKQYDTIEKYIMDYITLYGLDIIKSSSNYHLQILNTNIKRWNKITTKYKIFNNHKYKNIFYTCLEICIVLSKKNIDFTDLFEDIELIVINQNINNIIKYAIDNNKSIIIDKFIQYNRKLVYNTLCNLYNDTIINHIDKHTFTSKSIFKII